MNDETYSFVADVREKSSIARSAHCKRQRPAKAGFKDYTEKELREMSGPTLTYNLNRAMAYSDFASLPQDLQEKYLRNIVEHWQVGAYTIGPVMNCSGQIIAKKMKAFGIQPHLYPSKVQRDKFKHEFCGLAEPEPKKDTVKRVSAPGLALQNMAVCFFGAYSPEAIAQRLGNIIPHGQRVKIRVEIEVAD